MADSAALDWLSYETRRPSVKQTPDGSSRGLQNECQSTRTKDCGERSRSSQHESDSDYDSDSGDELDQQEESQTSVMNMSRRWGGGCRRKTRKLQGTVKVRPGTGKLMSTLMGLLTMCHSGQGVADVIMQTAALSTITAAAAMTIISVSLGLCGYNSWRVASKGISRGAWKHLLPTTAACWWNVSNTNALLLGSTLALTACVVVATAVCTDLTFSSATTTTATNQAAGAWEH